MNIFTRICRSFKYGANSPLTRPETAYMYAANIAPPKVEINVTPLRGPDYPLLATRYPLLHK